VHFRQFYVGCLAHASYLIGDGGEAVVVDPSRDIQMYLDEAAAHGLTIKWILETHLHADFVSGHRELAQRTGATIAIGARAEAGYPHRALADGDEIAFGGGRIRALETPGHTPEHISYLVFEKAGDTTPWGVLTGDTLFVGDVGRVDILSSRLPVADLAGMLYDSLHKKLLALPDDTRVYPAHGAGSLCGRSMSKDTWSTIGREREMNVALRPMTREEFIADVTRDVPETPVYFLHSRDLNKSGPSLDAERALPPRLAPKTVAERVAEGAVLLDVRPAAEFAALHPNGALHVGLDGQYASWVGTLVNPDQDLVLLADPEREEEAVMRLARVGYERVVGVVDGGIAAWQGAGLPVQSLDTVPIAALAEPADGRRVLDVRRDNEWRSGHLPGATHVPLHLLPKRLAELPRDAAWTVVCGGGYRASIGASVLQSAGFRNVTAAREGVDNWRKAGMPLEDVPTTA
jgi:glyoxylase-like metal-dependent hydrolase (beta-lactamase superfamily II)/rhodanese-related sulfurtransferase